MVSRSTQKMNICKGIGYLIKILLLLFLHTRVTRSIFGTSSCAWIILKPFKIIRTFEWLTQYIRISKWIILIFWLQGILSLSIVKTTYRTTVKTFTEKEKLEIFDYSLCYSILYFFSHNAQYRFYLGCWLTYIIWQPYHLDLLQTRHPHLPGNAQKVSQMLKLILSSKR